MHRLSLLIFVMLLIATAVFIAGTAGELPERVATHFVAGGRANGWMTRDGYLEFTLVLAIALPIVVAALLAGVSKLAPRSMNLPHRTYWLADERRADTEATLTLYASWLGVLLCCFVAAMHYSILEANAVAPPQLPTRLFVAIVACFLVALVAWMGALFTRFHRPA